MIVTIPTIPKLTLNEIDEIKDSDLFYKYTQSPTRVIFSGTPVRLVRGENNSRAFQIIDSISMNHYAHIDTVMDNYVKVEVAHSLFPEMFI